MTDAWPLILGAALCFGALLVALLQINASRIPRARGLSRSRSRTLAGVAHRAEAVTDEVLRRGGQRSLIGAGLEQAGIDLRPGEFMLIVCLVAVVTFAAGWVAVAPLAGLLLGLLVVVLSKVVVSLLAARRRSQFVDQLTETLQLLTGSLRSGNGLTQALDTVARESESPTAEEFRRLLVETRLGRDLSESLQALAERMRSRDMLWLVQAIDINREVGGNLAEILDTITLTIRDRTHLRRRVRALTAEGRLTAIVVMVLPFALGGFMAFSNPAYVDVLFTTRAGWMLLAAGGGGLVVGGLWLRKLVSPVF